MELCDNAVGCDKFGFVDTASTCTLYGSIGNANVGSTVGTICGTKGHVAPHSSYTDTTNVNDTETHCFTLHGVMNSELNLTEYNMLSATFHECVGACNSNVECHAFDYIDNTTCSFHTGIVSAFIYINPEESHRCFIKDEELLGEFVRHEDYGCGADLLSAEVSAVHDEVSCYLLCHDDNECGGFEYVPSSESCFMYGEVTLGPFDGRDCYVRGSGVNDNIGFHVGRVIFPDSKYSHDDDAAVSNYLEVILEDVLDKDVIMTAVIEASYGSVFDFIVDDAHPFALDKESTVFLIDEIHETGDPYNLGSQALGANNPAPFTDRPSVSPTTSPSASPTTTSPTLSPTRSPTFAASEVVHRFEVHAGKACGLDPTGNFSDVDVFMCIERCDNDPTCAHATFKESLSQCHTFVAEDEYLVDDATSFCLEKKYVAPHNGYDKEPDTTCIGTDLFVQFTDSVMDNVDERECSALCSVYHECFAFNFDTSSDSCTFLSGGITTGSGGGVVDCHVKDSNIAGAYIGHVNAACGNDVIGVVDNVHNDWHSCWLSCNGDNLCAGFEYYSTPKTCIFYNDVLLKLVTGKTCYSRSYSTDAYNGKHLGRLHFIDAVWNDAVHETLVFQTYMEGVIEHITGKNVTIIAVYPGSVVVEFVSDDVDGPALGDQDAYLILDDIVAFNLYDLGNSIVGGTEPPPPTAAPTDAPVEPTAVPTNTPTSSPTVTPPTMPPSMPLTPTTPPTSVVDGVFEGHRTIEIVSFTLIGLASTVFLYVFLRLVYIAVKGSYTKL